MTPATLQLVSSVPSTSDQLVEPAGAGLDEESREWLRSLQAEGSVRKDAVARLHALLLRATSNLAARRRSACRRVSASSRTGPSARNERSHSRDSSSSGVVPGSASTPCTAGGLDTGESVAATVA